LLADGRAYLLGGNSPGLADVHTVWVWDWLFGMTVEMEGFRETEVIAREKYPKTYAWVVRFRKFVGDVRKEAGEVEVVSDKTAIGKVLSGEYAEHVMDIDPAEPLGLSKGQLIEVWPSDSGSKHHDKGKLVSICVREVVIDSEVPNGKGTLRLHFPRINFRIVPVQNAKL
jgi:hypothetical protein